MAEARHLTRTRPAHKSGRASSKAGADLSHRAAVLGALIAGQRLGREYQHDATALARKLGVYVRCIPRQDLQNPDRPNTEILGRHWNVGSHDFIEVAGDLSPYMENRVVAHELGHHLGFRTESEAQTFGIAYSSASGS